MKRPIIGVIGNTRLVENKFPAQFVGERNLRAVADVTGALPLMFAGTPEITDVGALLDAVDGILLTGGRANVHPSRFGVAPIPSMSPMTSCATRWRSRSSRRRWRAPCRCSASAAGSRR